MSFRDACAIGTDDHANTCPGSFTSRNCLGGLGGAPTWTACTAAATIALIALTSSAGAAAAGGGDV